MSATPESTIGVAGAPEVAAALREIGYTVITGTTFRESAIAIAAQLKQFPVHVVVEVMNEPGFTPWVISTHAKSNGVVLLPTSDAVDLSGQLAGIPTLELPATVNALLSEIGAAPALADAGEVRIEATVVPAAVTPVETAPVLPPAPPAQEDAFAALMAQAGSGAGPVTDPFAATDTTSSPFPAETVPAVVDPFEQMASATPNSEMAEVAPAVESEPVAELGTANPVSPQSSPVNDPYAASSISGADVNESALPDSFLDSLAQIATVEPQAEAVSRIPLPKPTEVEDPAPIPVVEQAPVPAQGIVKSPEPALTHHSAVTPAPVPVRAPEPAPEQSEFIRQVLSRKEVRPVHSAQTPVWEQTPALVPGPDLGDFFGGSGISTGGCQVIVSLAGKGGAGKTTQTLMYAQTAGAAGLRVLVIDANRDQGDIGTSLRIEKSGFATVLQSVQGHPNDAIISKDQINAARPAAARDIAFDVVLAPPREFAGPRYASAQVYAKLLAYAKTRYDLVVIDTQIVEAQKSDLHTGFIIPELRSGAWSAGIALYDYSAIRNAFAVFDELAALGVTPQRTLVVATRWPEKENDADRFVSQFGQFGTFVGFVGDDPNVNAQKSVGNLLIESPAVAPVVRTLLYRVTNNTAFAPVEEAGRRKRNKGAGPKRERRGLFGGRK